MDLRYLFQENPKKEKTKKKKKVNSNIKKIGQFYSIAKKNKSKRK